MGPGPTGPHQLLHLGFERPQSFAFSHCPYASQPESSQIPILQITAEVSTLSLSLVKTCHAPGQYDMSVIGVALRVAIPGERRPSGRLHLPASALAEV